MTFQPVNSLLSWFIATEWKQIFHTELYWRLCGLTYSPLVKYRLNWGWCAWSTEGSLKQWLPNGKLLLLSLTKCHGVPCSLPSRIATKVLKNCKTFSSRPRPRPNVQDQDQDFMIQNQDQDFHFCPRDKDPGLEDYITGIEPLTVTYSRQLVNKCVDSVYITMWPLAKIAAESDS